MESNYYKRVLKRINECDDITWTASLGYRTDNGLVITTHGVYYLRIPVPLTDVELSKLQEAVKRKFNEKEELRRAEILKTL